MSEKRKKFLVVFEGLRGPAFTLYYDELPTPQMLRTLPSVIRRWELTNSAWYSASLTEIIAEYKRRFVSGKLPPDNIVKVRKTKS